MRVARSILKLTRLDSSLLIALAIFIPILARTRNLALSLEKATPLLFIGMCTYIANDLDDIEKDQINHPERPLPSGQVTPSFAAVLYFVCLASALLATKFYIDSVTAFWYYALLAISISYGYVVDCFPGFKAPYVAAAISLPVLIVATSYSEGGQLYLVAVAAFFFAFGRELCMDFLDRSGDAASFMHRIKPRRLAVAAFSSQGIGLILLAIQADRVGDVVVLISMLGLLVLSGIYWFKLEVYKTTIFLMKVQFLVGLYFLI